MKQAAQECEIEGIFEKILYRDDSNGWSVARITVLPSHDLITATGTFFGIHPGERVLVRGKWINREPYGQQFQMDSFVPLKPGTLNGIREYLASGFIQGVGNETARKLIDTFGNGIIDIIENHPERLAEVRGIGRKGARKIHDAWRAHHEMSDSMIFLQAEGISASYAYRIYLFYGSDAARIIRENPYRLCYDILGIGFKIADRIALKLGIAQDSPRRVRAGVIYVLGQVSENGNICYPWAGLISRAMQILEIPEPKVRDALEELAFEGELIVTDHAGKSFVYLSALHDAEARIAKGLKALLSAPSHLNVTDIPRAVRWFEDTYGIQFAQEQKDALASALSEKILVITGGPGTGKTTLISGITEICERRGLKVHLCAPTGRAAKRMSEATQREAKTIHRLFEFNPADLGRYGQEVRKISSDVLIIDEVSMVDALLFARVLQGIDIGTTLILVGDSDQLPSVGPGNVLMDIIRSDFVKTIRLKAIFRQALKSLIVINAHRINQGLKPFEKGEDTKEDYFFIRRDNPQEIIELIKELVAKRIPKRFGFDPFREIQVLSPMHKGILGVENLNTELQALLNPSGRELIHGTRRFCEGDKVMQLRNNYENGIFNGDMGTVMFVDAGKKIMDIDFEGRIIRYEKATMDELAVSYACSIHKSQGNEYPAVVLVLHTQHGIMLQRNLLYTAMTRGKSLVALVGNERAIEVAVANVIRARRYTLLTERLQGLI